MTLFFVILMSVLITMYDRFLPRLSPGSATLAGDRRVRRAPDDGRRALGRGESPGRRRRGRLGVGWRLMSRAPGRRLAAHHVYRCRPPWVGSPGPFRRCAVRLVPRRGHRPAIGMNLSVP